MRQTLWEMEQTLREIDKDLKELLLELADETREHLSSVRHLNIKLDRLFEGQQKLQTFMGAHHEETLAKSDEVLRLLDVKLNDLRSWFRAGPAKAMPKHMEPIKKEFEQRIEAIQDTIIPRRIESLLREGKRTFTQLKQELNTTDPTLAKHLKRLHMEGRLERYKKGRNVFYTLSPKPIHLTRP
jgi:DNA-binding transcriptional ArsR family regulator